MAKSWQNGIELVTRLDFIADQQANSADGQFDIDLNFGHTTNNGATFTQEQSSLINEIPVTADLDLVTEAVLQEINKPDPKDPTIAQVSKNDSAKDCFPPFSLD